MPHPVLDASERFKAAARMREAVATARLARAYASAYRALNAEIDALVEAVAARGGVMTQREMLRLPALRALEEQVREQVNRFAVTADQMIVERVWSEAERAMGDSQQLVEAYFDNDWLGTFDLAFGDDLRAQVRAAWTRVPIESVETLVGMVQEGSPLRTALVNRLGEAVADRMTEQMVIGIALGKNPRTIARQVMGEGLTWAETTVRTAQLNAYRYATRANYRANRDVVSGWRWLATLDSRTCMSCLAMHGTLHDVDEVQNDHHSGRCTQIPVVPLAIMLGIPQPEIPSAEEWFRRQSAATQQEQMGKGMWRLWQEGTVQFGRLTTTYTDPVYGTMRRAPTLAQVAAQ